MNTRQIALSWACLFTVLGAVGLVAIGQETDPMASIRKATDEVAAADKVVVAARNALAAAQRNLDVTQFNSAAYNGRITAEQEKAAKDKYDKAEGSAKADALEVLELAQELAAQRKTALDDAEKLLPQREAEAKAAEEKYATTRAVAEKAAGELRALVRQTEAASAARLKDSKLAIEAATFAKAAADQTAAVNAGIVKAFAAIAAADAAVQQATDVARQATAAERAQKMVLVGNALKAYAAAVQTATSHLPSFRADPTKPLFLELRVPLAEAEQKLQAARTALQQASQELQSRTDSEKKARERVKAAQDGVASRIAKTAAKKELQRETEAADRAAAARIEAEKAVAARQAEVAQAQQVHDGALQSAVGALIQSPTSLAAEKAILAKALAEREAVLKKENEELASRAAQAQAAADKAAAELTATDKLLAARVSAREALDKVLRQRFYRDVGYAQDALRRDENALVAAQRELQPKLAEFNQATAAHAAAASALDKAKQAAAAQAATLASVAKEIAAAEQLVRDRNAAKSAAEQAAKDAQAALAAARAEVAKVAAEGKAAAESQVKERDAAAQAANQKLQAADEGAKTAQAALQKATALQQTARTKAAEVDTSVRDADTKLAVARATLDKVTAAKEASDRLVRERQAAFDTAPVAVAVAKAAAYGGLKPLDPSTWDYAKARHLMVRAGFGGTPDEVTALQAMGLHRAVNYFVDFHKQPAAEVAFAARPRPQPENYEAAFSGEEQRRMREQRVAQDRQQMELMRQWWLRRMIESPRPLQEKLTLFWHGQIPVQYTTVGDSYYMYLQNQLYRENAAGNFSTLLYGIAHDAAMLKYLNNDTNVKGRANENLAREIIELFSMGRDQGYTEIDIRQGARALTGYTYDAATGQFRFLSDRHDTEAKTIFGRTGNWSGDDYVNLILETPYPPRFIARQLFTFFVHDHPTIDNVESLANVLRANRYELAPMLENLFLSEEFYSADAMSTEIKSPVQLVVGLHRDLGLKNPNYSYLASACREMGQDLFEPPSVFGWQTGRSWVTTSRVLSRYNVLAEVLERQPRAGRAGVDVLGTILAGKQFQNHGEVVDYLVKCCWAVPLTQNKREALLDFLKPLPEPAKWAADANTVNTRLTRLLSMLMCSPEYQLG